MRIVLVQPPIQDFYDTDVRLQPIGLCYLKAAIEKHHPDVEVIVRGEGERPMVELISALKEERPLWTVPNSPNECELSFVERQQDEG